MPKDKKSEGKIPGVIVNHINEHTIGGFILFYFNQETGEPEQLMSFDSPAHCLALQKHINDWQEAIHAVSLENSVYLIHKNIQVSNKKRKSE
jgi:hypothetical protein